MTEKAIEIFTKNEWGLIKGRYELTPRQVEVAKLLLQGLEAKEVAEKLNITLGTVKTHKRDIYDKLAVEKLMEMLQKFMYVARSKIFNEEVLKSIAKEIYGLTPKEVEVLGLLFRGLEEKKVAKKLGMKTGTVKNHARNMYRGVGTRGLMKTLLKLFETAQSQETQENVP